MLLDVQTAGPISVGSQYELSRPPVAAVWFAEGFKGWVADTAEGMGFEEGWRWASEKRQD